MFESGKKRERQINLSFTQFAISLQDGNEEQKALYRFFEDEFDPVNRNNELGYWTVALSTDFALNLEKQISKLLKDDGLNCSVKMVKGFDLHVSVEW